MSRPAYMQETWFAVLQAHVEASSMTAVARRLDVSRGAVSQVLNGTGLYGTGAATTKRFSARVLALLSQMQCPFLSTAAGEPRFIAGEQCRQYAYREAPSNSPLAVRHWQACRTCAARVPAPKGWDESSRRFIEIHATARTARSRDASPGVAAPAPSPTPEEAA